MTMENGLKYLTDTDVKMLEKKAKRVSFSNGQALITQGSDPRGMFILRNGLVRVECSHLGRGIAVARLGPGDVIGEISFLELQGATASVVADGDVEADLVSGEDLNSLLVSMPSLATRFYRSLALVLSHRLRELTSQLPPLLVEDVPQVNRFHAPRTGLEQKRQIPPKLQNDLEDFKTAMLLVDRALKDRKLSDSEAQIRVSAACSALNDSLCWHVASQSDLAPAIGAHVFRETFPLLMLSRMNDRSFAKPRGYAGDYATIEMMYENKPTGDGRLGRFIDAWYLEQKPTVAVKNRRVLLGQAIQAEMNNWRKDTPMPVASLGSGPAQELFDVLRVPQKPNLHATCIDIDHEALGYVASSAEKEGLSSFFTLAQDNLVHLAQGKGHTTILPQQLMYSVGLIDYLKDQFVTLLLNWTFDRLLPGGTVILGNFDSQNRDKPYMDYILEWVLIHRTPDEMKGLFRQSKFQAARVNVTHEQSGVNLFAFCTKPL
jgi:extracellular factor (EF) 3-hydroxypalmitic acid methyl ester biosynthesis protein